MNKIKSLSDLRKIKQDVENRLDLREKSDNPERHVQIKVAMATCGIASGAREVMNAFIEKIAQDKLDAIVTQTGCMGYCHAEPTVEIRKPGEEPIVYGHVDVEKAVAIVDKYIKQGELLEGIIPVNYQTV
ncbi:MAG: (2Fe-2S) ferredoxin domain-containing protein [Prevotellaceae bacterium]|jgi:NADP-reducing hydrogenase subunit HndB|nr:(2Fe-2S) ferredoxin domain-containing protein [Prevotellaceae bacterium]